MTSAPPYVEGNGGLPKIALVAADGARFEAYLHGAQVTSWYPAGGADDRLFLSEAAHFASGEAIRGGIPVSFPQFADQGPLPMHGFARVMPWRVVSAGRRNDGAAYARLQLTDDASTRALWPHEFACELEVAASGPTLTVELRIANPGRDAFDFTTALHTYLRVADVRDVRIGGLEGAHYRDKVLRTTDAIERAAALSIDRPIDRVYHAVPDVILVREPRATLQVRAAGTTDTVVWNPGPSSATTPSDLTPDAYRTFLCVEAAIARAPLTLAPGQGFRGSQTLTST